MDITANHQGHFTFKLCPNNDIWADPDQGCFDRWDTRSVFSPDVGNYQTALCRQVCSRHGQGWIRAVPHQWLHHRAQTGLCSPSPNVSVTKHIFIGVQFSSSMFGHEPMLQLQGVLWAMHPAVDLHSGQQLGRVCQWDRRPWMRTSGWMTFRY